MSDQLALPRHLFAWLQDNRVIAPTGNDGNAGAPRQDDGQSNGNSFSREKRVRGRNETILSVEETKAVRSGAFFLRVVKRCLKTDISIPELDDGCRSPNALKIIYTRLCRFLPVKCSKERLETLSGSNDKLLIELLSDLETVGGRKGRNNALRELNSILGVTVETNDIDRILGNRDMSLDKTETIGEFLVTSICSKLLPNITPEQAAALLGSKDSKLLHKVIANGVQGVFQTVEAWIFEMHRSVNKFATLLSEASEPDSRGVLQILRSLLYSTHSSAASAGCKLLEALLNELPPRRMMSRLMWEWLTDNHFQAVLLCWQRYENCRDQLARIVLWICTNHKKQNYVSYLFEGALAEAFIEVTEYISFVQDMLRVWLSQGLPLNFDKETGVPSILEKHHIPQLLISFASQRCTPLYDYRVSPSFSLRCNCSIGSRHHLTFLFAL